MKIQSTKQQQVAFLSAIPHLYNRNSVNISGSPFGKPHSSLIPAQFQPHSSPIPSFHSIIPALFHHSSLIPFHHSIPYFRGSRQATEAFDKIRDRLLPCDVVIIRLLRYFLKIYVTQTTQHARHLSGAAFVLIFTRGWYYHYCFSGIQYMSTRARKIFCKTFAC